MLFRLERGSESNKRNQFKQIQMPRWLPGFFFFFPVLLMTGLTSLVELEALLCLPNFPDFIPEPQAWAGWDQGCLATSCRCRPCCLAFPPPPRSLVSGADPRTRTLGTHLTSVSPKVMFANHSVKHGSFHLSHLSSSTVSCFSPNHLPLRRLCSPV